MQFKFFLGVANGEQLKEKYRKLAMTLHPDKGGNSKDFVAMKTEYEHIKGNAFVPYPIANAPKRNMAQNMADIFREAARRTQAKEAARAQSTYQQPFSRPQYQGGNGSETEEAKWTRLFQTEPLYQVVRSIIQEAFNGGRTANYMLMEMYKVDELTLEHFNFAAWILQHSLAVKGITINKSWAKETYKVYLNIHSINWVAK
jgi:hypothetical protein